MFNFQLNFNFMNDENRTKRFCCQQVIHMKFELNVSILITSMLIIEYFQTRVPKLCNRERGSNNNKTISKQTLRECNYNCRNVTLVLYVPTDNELSQQYKKEKKIKMYEMSERDLNGASNYKSCILETRCKSENSLNIFIAAPIQITYRFILLYSLTMSMLHSNNW